MTILRRPGNKSVLADQIISLFPKHTFYIEPFFGTGAIFFKKSLASNNIINDIDKLIYNFWLFAKEKINLDKLIEELKITPFDENVFKYYKDYQGDNVLELSIKEIILSHLSIYGGRTNVRKEYSSKEGLLSKIKDFLKNDYLSSATIFSMDFREIFKVIETNRNRDHPSFSNAFVYCDPPYLGRSINGYDILIWEQRDTEDLFELCVNSGINFAISESDHPIVIELANKYNLQVIELDFTCSPKFQRKELLITNYSVGRLQMSLWN